MKSIKAFERFAKGKPINAVRNNTCVIYTRVSTREQAEHNMSLDTQRRACETYARKHGYRITAYFGGTYESAKTDERVEFNNMLSFVEKSREKMSYIIVYSVDRFSRSGANAIYIAEQLKLAGINVLSVSQPTDVNTPSGSLQQNIQFIFSEYDNQLRREKSVAGMRDKLLRGEWFVKPPIGYDSITKNGKRAIVVNETGGLIRKAFLWKYYEHLPQNEITQRLRAMGMKLSRSSMSCILKNPFYCGIISNKLLEGKVVQGKHEKLISQELFLAVNELLSNARKPNSRYCIDNDFLPLKQTLYCHKCKIKMSGYVNQKKILPYYKCRTIGCSTNKNANQLGVLFRKLLSTVKIDEKKYPALKKEFSRNFIKIERMTHESIKTHRVYLTRVKKNIELIEERFSLGEIKEPLYNRQLAKFQKEKNEIEMQMEQIQAGIIRKAHIKEEAERVINDLSEVWESGNLRTKKLIQTLIFPEGIFYNKALNKIFVAKLTPGFYLAKS